MNPYIVGALALVIAGLTATMFYYKASAATARAETRQAISDRDAAVAVTKTLNETIAVQEANEKRNNRIIVEMADDLNKIQSDVSQTKDQVGELKDANDDIRTYLNAVVPDDINKLLNK